MPLLAVCLIAVAFGFVGSMPLAGPIAILTVSRAAHGKFGEALRVALGGAAAEAIYAGVAFWGFTTFLARHAVVVPISQGATSLVLMGLGIRFVYWHPPATNGEPENKAGTVLLGFSVSALNPTLFLTWSAGVAFVYSKGIEQPSAAYAVPFGICAGAGVAAWFASLVALLRKYGGHLPRAALMWTVRAMGVVLVGLGAWSGVRLAQWLAHA